MIEKKRKRNLFVHLHEIVKVALVRNHLLAFKVKHVGADAVEEVLVVRDDKKNLLPLLQVVVQPDDGVEVKMIRRLRESGRVSKTE